MPSRLVPSLADCTAYVARTSPVVAGARERPAGPLVPRARRVAVRLSADPAVTSRISAPIWMKNATTAENAAAEVTGMVVTEALMPDDSVVVGLLAPISSGLYGPSI